MGRRHSLEVSKIVGQKCNREPTHAWADVLIVSLGGAVNAVNFDATSFAHRNSRYHLQFNTFFEQLDYSKGDIWSSNTCSNSEAPFTRIFSDSNAYSPWSPSW